MFDLQVFDYEHNQEVRTIFANGEIWFVAKDVCGILEITDHLQAVEKLDDEERGGYKIPTPYGLQEMGCINEPGLYRLIFRSNKPEAKKFQKWIYKEVIPQIRKTGFYSLRGSMIPAFIRRYNENWDRVEQGYFSVINELVIRIYGRLEHVGYMMPDKGLSGREMRPDISVGKLFAAWIKEQHPEHENDFKMYKHVLPDGKEIDARQYKAEIWHLFIQYVDTVWMKERAHNYFIERDPNAIEYLAKLIPDFKIPAAAIDHDEKK